MAIRFIETVGDLKKVIENLDDNFKIKITTERTLKEEELDPIYPYPKEVIERQLEFGDIGYSDKIIKFDVNID